MSDYIPYLISGEDVARDISYKESHRYLMSRLAQVIAPVAGEVELTEINNILDSQGAISLCVWEVRVKSAAMLPFYLTYKADNGWHLEDADGSAVSIAPPPYYQVDWATDEVRAFLRRQVCVEDDSVNVLVYWNDNQLFDCALVRFSSKDVVRQLYDLSTGIKPLAQSAAGLKVTSVHVELSAATVSAFQTNDDRMEDGLLIERQTAQAGEEITSLYLRVRDDGMLIISSDEWSGWVDLDLEMLAYEVGVN